MRMLSVRQTLAPAQRVGLDEHLRHICFAFQLLRQASCHLRQDGKRRRAPLSGKFQHGAGQQLLSKVCCPMRTVVPSGPPPITVTWRISATAQVTVAELNTLRKVFGCEYLRFQMAPGMIYYLVCKSLIMGSRVAMVPSPWRRCEWAGGQTVVGDVMLHGEPVRLGQEVHHMLTGVGEAGGQRRLATARGDQQFVPADLLGGDVLLARARPCDTLSRLVKQHCLEPDLWKSSGYITEHQGTRGWRVEGSGSTTNVDMSQ